MADPLVLAHVNGWIVGAAGVECYAAGALLRSVVVDPSVQGQGLGQRLTEAALALALARARDEPTVFLLTTTAERFFLRFGFEAISRESVPESVRRSVEFQSACQASAIVLRRQLR
jgi:amino-acid N-acetyltransferase